MVAGHDLRRRWVATVAIALLIGVVGAVVMAAAAGARRSGTAVERFNTFSRSSDLEVDLGIPTDAQVRAFVRGGTRDVGGDTRVRDQSRRPAQPRHRRPDRRPPRHARRPPADHRRAARRSERAGRDHDRRSALGARAPARRQLPRRRVADTRAARRDQRQRRPFGGRPQPARAAAAPPRRRHHPPAVRPERPVCLGRRSAARRPAFNRKYARQDRAVHRRGADAYGEGAAGRDRVLALARARTSESSPFFSSSDSYCGEPRARPRRSTCSRSRCGSLPRSPRSAGMVAIAIVLSRRDRPDRRRTKQRSRRSGSRAGDRMAAVGPRAGRARGRRRVRRRGGRGRSSRRCSRSASPAAPIPMRACTPTGSCSDSACSASSCSSGSSRSSSAVRATRDVLDPLHPSRVDAHPRPAARGVRSAADCSGRGADGGGPRSRRARAPGPVGLRRRDRRRARRHRRDRVRREPRAISSRRHTCSAGRGTSRHPTTASRRRATVPISASTARPA